MKAHTIKGNYLNRIRKKLNDSRGKKSSKFQEHITNINSKTLSKSYETKRARVCVCMNFFNYTPKHILRLPNYLTLRGIKCYFSK